MRLFTRSTLDLCYIFRKKISELPAGAKKAHTSCAQRSRASKYKKTEVGGVEPTLLMVYFELYV
jgi:hypothetical protein